MRLRTFTLSLVFALLSTFPAHAEVALPSIFGDHMVLQRDMPVPIWGWADPGETVRVAIAGQEQTTTADGQGRWMVRLEPLPTGDPLTLTVQGKNKVQLQDVLVGEVWICSGQSNMEWPVSASWDADLTIATARHPRIRLITVHTPGVQQPLQDFPGQWQRCSPESVANFSAVGYAFGRQLQEVLDVPVGLIDNAWGGSSAEAWVRRDLLQDNELYEPLLARWQTTESNPELREPYQQFEQALDQWVQQYVQAKQHGKPESQRPPMPAAPPRSPMVNQHRPGNLYNARLQPIMPFAIRGVIWYQGESNAGRAYQYRDLFPRMIQNWRDDWNQGDFPFYWVQLADYMQEKPEPSESAWAELREAQTQTMDRLPNTGEAVIIDLGEASDIHPRNKRDVGKRLARWALAQTYDQPFVHRSPRFKALESNEGKLVVTFDHVGGGLRTVDRRELVGFAIAGEDRKWVWAEAQIVAGPDGTKDRVQVWSDQVAHPVAVRYAWADNPVANLYSQEGLPATPFRSDDWPGVTADKRD